MTKPVPISRACTVDALEDDPGHRWIRHGAAHHGFSALRCTGCTLIFHPSPATSHLWIVTNTTGDEHCSRCHVASIQASGQSLPMRCAGESQYDIKAKAKAKEAPPVRRYRKPKFTRY